MANDPERDAYRLAFLKKRIAADTAEVERLEREKASSEHRWPETTIPSGPARG